jgi:hypothetical protein
MSPKDEFDLHEYLDTHFTRVIENAKKLTPEMDEVARAGTIAGFLMKTGIKLAAKHGAPRGIVEASLLQTVSEYYGS